MTDKQLDDLTNKIRNALVREHNWQAQENQWLAQEKQRIMQLWLWAGTVVILSLTAIFH